MTERFPLPPEDGVAYVRDRYSLPIGKIDSAHEAEVEARRLGQWHVMHMAASGGRDLIACEDNYPVRRKIYLHRVIADLMGLEGHRVSFRNGDSFDCRSANIIVASRGGARPGATGPRPGRRPFQPAGITRRQVGPDMYALGPGPRVPRPQATRHDIDTILGYVMRTGAQAYEWQLAGREWHSGYGNFHDASFALCDAAGYRP